MSTTATRLITLIMLLQRRPNQKAADLAEELDVSVRTLHRYFAMLDEMGIPIYSERGRYGGFSLVRGYKLPPLVFTPDEAAAIYLGTSLVGEMWGELYSDAALGAMAKLDNVLPDEQRREVDWARRSLVATGMHRADPAELSPFLETLRKAAHERIQVELIYQGSAKAEPTQRMVDPYALVFRSGWWYLVGFCHLRQALRTFRIDRVQSLKLAEDNFKLPSDFDVHDYFLRSLEDQPLKRARLRFVPDAAQLASGLPGYQSSLELPDGSLEVVITAPDLSWLASLVLSFTTWATVLEPPELRDMVRDWAQATADQYQ
jgi:predicted DNA-binding transcriptional regulator YafY